MVMEYYSDAGSSKQQSSTSYFDKNIWLKYVSEMMPSLPEQFKLSRDEPNNILKATYTTFRQPQIPHCHNNESKQ